MYVSVFNILPTAGPPAHSLELVCVCDTCTRFHTSMRLMLMLSLSDAARHIMQRITLGCFAKCKRLIGVPSCSPYISLSLSILLFYVFEQTHSISKV